MSDETQLKLASALTSLVDVIGKQTQLLELLVESIPATQEAKLLGVSQWTVRRRRKARKLERLVS